MQRTFIANFHFDNPSQKLSKEWAMKVVNYCCYNTRNKGLLEGKNIEEIDGYATGDFDMKPFLRMFKSMKKSLAAMGKDTNLKNISGNDNPLGIEITPFPLIPEKLNSAEAIVSKIPVEISCVANDPLAIEKKKKDIEFIKNKPAIEADLQEISDRLGLGKFDLGTTENSSTEYSDSPFGLDLNEPDELDIFVNLLYSLKIETAFETALQAYYDLKLLKQLKLLEIKDQYRYGVSAHRAYQNSMTGLPDAEYLHPANVEVPHSLLQDFSDNSHRVINHRLTVTELFDSFGSDIGSKEELERIMITGSDCYCARNNIQGINTGNFDSMKVNLKYVEVKSIDWVGISEGKKSKSGYRYLTTNEDEVSYKVWAQNTYCFWWLVNTDKVFSISKLGFTQRTRGLESFQNFTSNIYRSQVKSAVELSIGENKKAQIADLKLQHALIKSLPPGRYIDQRYLRGALEGTKDGVNEEGMQKLLNMAYEQNIILGDTEGFDGKNDGQFKPVIDLAGGLGNVTGYANIIIAADINISRITGINQQLTGTSANPEGLIGLQKLLINSSINSLQYCTDAMNVQYQKLFANWTNVIKSSIEEGGKTREAIVAIIGSRKANVIDGLNDIGLHQIGVVIKIGQREEERARYEMKLSYLRQQGVISAADEFLLDNVTNIKDRYALLATKEIKWKREQAQIREQQFAQQQQLTQQQGQNQIAAKQAEAQGDKEAIYAKGEVEAKITQLASQLGISALQMDGLIKASLQKDRNRAQTDKNIATLTTKANLEQQESLL